MKRNLCLSIGLTVVVALASSVSAQLKGIKVTYSAMSAASLVTWVAKDAGIFQKHGLDVGLIYIAGGSLAMATTIAGKHSSLKASARGPFSPSSAAPIP